MSGNPELLLKGILFVIKLKFVPPCAASVGIMILSLKNVLPSFKESFLLYMNRAVSISGFIWITSGSLDSGEESCAALQQYPLQHDIL